MTYANLSPYDEASVLAGVYLADGGGMPPASPWGRAGLCSTSREAVIYDLCQPLPL